MFKAISTLAWLALVPQLVAAQQLALRDPMRPYQAPAEPARGGAPGRSIELTAVVISSERRIAVINGELYREGDLVDGAKLVRVEADRVHLTRGDARVVVPLDAREEISEGDSGT